MEAKGLTLPPELRSELLHRLAIAVPDQPVDECWIPKLAPLPSGYVRLMFHGVQTGVHRWMYLALVGDPGAVLDHKVCDNRACCNPAHLEPSTHRANILRGTAPTATNASKSHCKRGHPFNEQNTYLCEGKNGKVRRICRACNNALTLRRYHERQAAKRQP